MIMRAVLLVSALFCCSVVYAQDSIKDTAFSYTDEFRENYSRYRVTFTDKHNSRYSVDNPETFLSQKAIERRKKYSIPITEEDLPVNESYLEALQKENAIVCNTSKWFNSAIVAFAGDRDSVISHVSTYSFVKSIEWVAPMIQNENEQHTLVEQTGITKDYDIITQNTGLAAEQLFLEISKAYGPSIDQNYMLGTINSHMAGYMGQGMTIAVVDAGFLHVDSVAAFQKLRKEGRLLLTKDVTGAESCLNLLPESIYDEGSHGLMVLSLIGAFYPGKLIGTAPQANFILIHSEEGATEYIVEEDNWVAAAEFADSAGADIISTSLGYSTFDDVTQNHTYTDMDGNTARITRGADIASSKGMLLVNSAGNSGNDPWKYITAPADADSVLTVGACNRKNKKTRFSSFGPTSDNRIKPDVMSLGLYPTIVTSNGSIRNSSGGTSFSCPLVAGCSAILWQEFPDSSAQTIREALIRSGDRYAKPNNKYGYGTVSVLRARYYFYAMSLYKTLSKQYVLPDFDEFYQDILDAYVPLSKTIAVVIYESKNDTRAYDYILRNHRYEADYPRVSDQGGLLSIIGKKTITYKIANRN